MRPLLEVKELTFEQDGKVILKNINFALHPGEALGVIGPNGGGKSTLLKVIVQNLKALKGEILYEGKQSFPPHFFSYLPQRPELNPTMPITVREYVEFGKKKSSQEVFKALSDLGLKEKEGKIFSELSGGERQRALLAKAILQRPKILLLDEPTNALDGLGQDQLLSIIKNFIETKECALIIVDHNISDVLRSCHRVLCLNQGHHWHDKKEMLTKEILESIYHCEFEHLKIHDVKGSAHPHHNCSGEHHVHELAQQKGRES